MLNQVIEDGDITWLYGAVTDSGVLNKFDATAAPGVTNDNSEGYSIGSYWIDTVGDKGYVCTDVSTGAANWIETTAGAAGGETNTASNIGTGGIGVFKQKVGVNFEFKKINAGSNKVTVTDDAGNNELDIDIDESNISHTAITDIGSNTHAQIDTQVTNSTNHISASTNIHGVGAGNDIASDADIATHAALEVGVHGNASPIVHTPVSGNTATLNLTAGKIHDITMPAGNITIAVSNEVNGQIFSIRVLQDGTGSRTVTWFSTIKWADDSAPTLTTDANKADTFIFRVTGTDTYDGFIVGQNI